MQTNTQKVVVVLGGGLRKDDTGRWCTVGLAQGGDNFAASNDRWRIDAAHTLWKSDPSTTLVPSAGQGQYKGTDTPAVAEVMASELVELGVPESAITKDIESGNTVEQLRMTAKLAREMGLRQVAVLSNEWHLARIQAMLDHAPGLVQAFTGILVNLVAAESILWAESKEWQERIKAARVDSGIMKRVELEANGVRQIQEGTYRWPPSSSV
ncbi:MAG: YdcF family protein [Patescibacteria group bacterium]